MVPRPSPCPHGWCSPFHLSDATMVTKPETWESSLAFPSLTHIQLVTMSSSLLPHPLSDLSPHLHLPCFGPHHFPSE